MAEGKPFPLRYPPGIFRNGTEFQARGRWYNADLVRFLEKTVRPIGGWENLQAGGLDIPFGPSSLLTLTANPANGETVIVEGKTYTFRTTLTDVDGYVFIGATASISLDNLIAARNLSAGAGTLYAASTTAGIGSAIADGGDTMRNVGTSGGAVSETLGNGSWDNATLVEDTPRAMIGWRSDAAAPQLVIGTNSHLYHFTQGALIDRTPAGLTVGGADSEFGVGAYGSGAYSAGAYGTGDPAQGTFTEAGMWSLDTWGDYLVGVLTSDGKMWQWDGVTDDLTQITNAPTNCDSLVVTAERFLFALGADGDPRLVKWPDKETLTVWTALDTNEAGDFPLPGEGVLMQGLRGKSETLLFTDADLFAARYIGGTLVYGFPKVGSACGVISRRGAVVVEGRAFWMGQRGFFTYDGYVDTLESDVSDYIFSDFNRTQRAKVWGMTMSDFGEVWWFYPSANSQECDRYVIYNYVENHWSIGELTRTCGIDRIAFEFPMMCSTVNVMDHERGSTRVGTPFLEGGPMQVDTGGRTVDIDELIPDESVGGVQGLGSLSATLFTRMYPTEDEVTHGPFTLASPTSLRISARQVRVRVDEVTAGDWRLGLLRLNAQPGSRR